MQLSADTIAEFLNYIQTNKQLSYHKLELDVHGGYTSCNAENLFEFLKRNEISIVHTKADYTYDFYVIHRPTNNSQSFTIKPQDWCEIPYIYNPKSVYCFLRLVEEATARLMSNKDCENCSNCIRCHHCTDCYDCVSCWYCKECSDCKDCHETRRSNNCEQCSNCHQCTHCDKCISCYDCKWCENCLRCSGSQHCKDCEAVRKGIRSKRCTNCMVITDCEDCKISTRLVRCDGVRRQHNLQDYRELSDKPLNYEYDPMKPIEIEEL